MYKQVFEITIMQCLGISISFQIIDFNIYEIINDENNKVWVVILKFFNFKNNGGINPNLNLKIFNLPNKKFKQILNFQMKS